MEISQFVKRYKFSLANTSFSQFQRGAGNQSGIVNRKGKLERGARICISADKRLAAMSAVNPVFLGEIRE